MRSNPEWIGKNDDEAPPPRVRLRVYDRCKGRCQGPCHRKLGPADKWQCDHIKPLIAGGENREKNLQCLCEWCHGEKTNGEVGEKSRVAAIRERHLGIKKSARPFQKPSPNWVKVSFGVYERRKE